MTLDEAKNLKPGDKVLVELTVETAIDSDGEIKIRSVRSEPFKSEIWFIAVKSIREKIDEPRRKFKKGDLVALKNGDILVVAVDENEFSHVCVSDYSMPKELFRYYARELILLCAAEDRADRKEEA